VNADDAPEHHEWYINQMGQTSRHVVLETLAYLGTQNLSDKLPAIHTPALAMVGELSEGDIPDRAQGQAEMMPNCTLARVPGAGGYVQHSAPEKCVLSWLEFVGTVHQPS
jgi:pimeloyl-ACP methyl ester carboxylesterase